MSETRILLYLIVVFCGLLLLWAICDWTAWK